MIMLWSLVSVNQNLNRCVFHLLQTIGVDKDRISSSWVCVNLILDI